MAEDHKLDGINIKPADNGYIVNHTMKSASKKDMPYDARYQDHSSVHESPEGAARHVAKLLRKHGRSNAGKRFNSGRTGGR